MLPQIIMSASTPTRTEFIICPKCQNVCKATVTLTIPLATYIHHCEHCHYIIMESEWDGISESDFTTQSPG